MAAAPWRRLARLCGGDDGGGGGAGLRCGGQLRPGPCGCSAAARAQGRAGHWTYEGEGDVVRLENPMPLFTGWGRDLLRCGPRDSCRTPFGGGEGGPGTVWVVGLGSFAAALERAGLGASGWPGRLCGAGDVLSVVGCVLRRFVRCDGAARVVIEDGAGEERGGGGEGEGRRYEEMIN